MDLKKILFLTAILGVIPFPEFNFDLDSFFKRSSVPRPKVELVDSLSLAKNNGGEYPLLYNLRDIRKDLPLEDNLVGVFPGKNVFLEGNDFDFNPTKIKTIYGDEKYFKKFLSLENKSKFFDWVRIGKDSLGRAVFDVENSGVLNGPFFVSPDGDRLRVESRYGNLDVIPSKVYLQKGNELKDSLEIINEKFYPPYYVSSFFKKKKELNSLDLLEVIGSYHNLKGDYFNSNHKNLVCTDVATLLIKTVGLDYEKMVRDSGIPGNDYAQRNVGVFRALLEKKGYSKYVHYFKGGDEEKIREEGVYENLIAKNFGMETIDPGQVMIYTRFYKTGPKRGSVQRWDAHLAAVSEVNGGLITKAAMVSSANHKPPYNENIRFMTDIDFKKWYGYRQEYRGSNETKETLMYRVYALVDMVKIINDMKKESN